MTATAKEAIRRALYDGRFQPGESLSEAALAKEMGVSRGPVREALLVLSQEGLVVHSPNRGFSVVEFTEQELREVDQVRATLETMALELARGHVEAGDIEQLRLLKNKLVQSYANDQMVECYHLDMRFHSLIWKCSGNFRLLATLHNLVAPVFAYGSLFSGRHSDLTPQRLDEEHECCIRYLEGDESRTAEQCVQFHLGQDTVQGDSGENATPGQVEWIAP